eukprot:2018062-Amphidinium_carterae.1
MEAPERRPSTAAFWTEGSKSQVAVLRLQRSSRLWPLALFAFGCHRCLLTSRQCVLARHNLLNRRCHTP